MHNWLVRGIFATAALFAIGAGALATIHLTETRRAGDWVQHTGQVLEAVRDLRAKIEGIHAAKHAMLRITPELADGAHRARTMAALERGRALTRDDPRQQQEIDTLQEMVQTELSELSATVALVKRGQADSARDLVRDEESERRADLMNRHLLQLTANEHELLRQRTQVMGQRAGLVRLYVAVVLIASILLAAAGAYLIRLGELRARRSASAADTAEVEARKSEGRFRAALDAMLDPFYIARRVNGGGPRSSSRWSRPTKPVWTWRAYRGPGCSVRDSGRCFPAVRPRLSPESAGASSRRERVTRESTGSIRRAAESDGSDCRWRRPMKASRWPATTSRATSAPRPRLPRLRCAMSSPVCSIAGDFARSPNRELMVARRTRRGDALLSLDLNEFKQINDAYGHAEGDAALREVSRVVRAALREVDVVARIGGDEFVVYAPGTDGSDNAHLLAARLSAAFAVANAKALGAGRAYALDAGIGVAVLEPGDTLDTLLARADLDLYTEKGRRTEARAV